MKGIEKIVKTIAKSKDIVIAGHVNPDGDSIGSILSLGLGLEQLGKRVHIISQDGVPKRYRSLPGAERIKKHAPVTPDLAISVDCGDRELLGDIFEVFRKADTILEIDHHEFRRPFGDMRLIDNKAAAVGELVYLLLKFLKVNVTKEIAQNILTSIIVETNSFKLPNVRDLTFFICADLMKSGVDFYELSDTVFWSKTKESALLLGTCLSRCKFLSNRAIAWSIVRDEDFKRVGGSDEDVDPVTDELRSIKDVKIAILFRERNNGLLRVSLRSKDGINVASIAERYNGGGHFDAAGCKIPYEKAAIKKVLSLAEDLLRVP